MTQTRSNTAIRLVLNNDRLTVTEQALSVTEDYKIYRRHYTEGVTETVMFFVPD